MAAEGRKESRPSDKSSMLNSVERTFGAVFVDVDKTSFVGFGKCLKFSDFGKCKFLVVSASPQARLENLETTATNAKTENFYLFGISAKCSSGRANRV
jgi:hypothetical protein